MSTTGNPVLFALRDLGTSVSNIFTADVARSQAELAAQHEENTQRRALESLRLSGEQQMAELGIKEAQTRYDITRGERQLGIQQQQTDIQGRQQQATEKYQTGQLAHLQADLDLRTTMEKNQQVLRVAQANAANAQERLAAAQTKTEGERYEAAKLVNETNKKLANTQVDVYGMMEALLGGKTATESDKAFFKAFVGNAEVKGFLTTESTLPYGVALPVAKGILDLRSAIEKSDDAMARRLYTDIGVKLLQAGKSNEEIAEYFDFVQSYAKDREGTTGKLQAIKQIAEQLRPALYQQKKITDPNKIPNKQLVEINKELYEQASRLYTERTSGTAAGTPAPAPPPAPEASPSPAALSPLIGAPGRPGSFTENRARYLPELSQAWGDLLVAPDEGPSRKPGRVLSILERQRLENAYVEGRAAGRTRDEMIESMRNLLGKQFSPPATKTLAPGEVKTMVPPAEDSVVQEFNQVFPERNEITGFNPYGGYLGLYRILRARQYTPQAARQYIEEVATGRKMQ